ncbi:hypothetical protein [Nocardia rhizosphaerihabitans]|nr:hypothetical protein [Nocardia rhizosphaerihabitans]
MVRLIISWDWNDVAAAKLLGLATAVGGLAVVVAVSVHAPDSVGVRKRWTPGRIVAAAVVAGLAAGGAARMILTWDLGDRVGQLLHETAIIALIVLYLVDWFPLRHARR